MSLGILTFEMLCKAWRTVGGWILPCLDYAHSHFCTNLLASLLVNSNQVGLNVGPGGAGSLPVLPSHS